jgi:beta-glucosidase
MVCATALIPEGQLAVASPGETAEVGIEIPSRATETWTENGWRCVGGDYIVQIGHSLADIRITTPVRYRM